MKDGERVFAWADRLGAFKTGPKSIIVPEQSRLTQNYPNPFNPTTTIDYDIGFLDGLYQDVEFNIYNIRGQIVKTLVDQQVQPGQYSVVWNGLDEMGKQVSSGIYFARLMTGKGYANTVKMLVLR
jgi:flagellar hook assembly protein FlgD